MEQLEVKSRRTVRQVVLPRVQSKIASEEYGLKPATRNRYMNGRFPEDAFFILNIGDRELFEAYIADLSDLFNQREQPIDQAA